MPSVPMSEIRELLSHAIETGDVLHVPSEARRIAGHYNLAADDVAEELTEAGILAGVNMEMGRPL
jgi:hypothetical protein